MKNNKDITDEQKNRFVEGLRKLSEETGVGINYYMDEGMFLDVYNGEGYSWEDETRFDFSRTELHEYEKDT